jgi:Trp operon repressor
MAFVSTIRHFAQVAKRSGAAEVYAIARRELDVGDLGLLLLHLRRVDPDWRLDVHERRRLAHALLEADVPDREIRDQLDISQKTLTRRRRELVQKRNRSLQPAFQSGVSGTKTATATHGSSSRVSPSCGFSADSGSVDDRPLRLLLGETS